MAFISILLILSGLSLGLLYPFFSLANAPFAFILMAALSFLSSLSMPAATSPNSPQPDSMGDAESPGRLPAFLTAKEIGTLIYALFLSQLVLPIAALSFCTLLIEDPILQLGIMFSAACPIALVMPFYVQRSAGNSKLALYIMLASTLLFPFTANFLVSHSFAGLYQFDYGYVGKVSWLLCVLPAAVGMLAQSRSARRLESFLSRLRSQLIWLNPFLLAALCFVVGGAVQHRTQGLSVDLPTALKLVGLGIFQNVLGFSLAWSFGYGLNGSHRLTLAISASAKNVALGAVILAFHLPKAALPSVFVLVAHSLLFGYYSRTKSRSTTQLS